MKKILSLMLACVLLLSLCACGSSAPAETGAANAGTTAAPAGNDSTFQVGFGEGNITPDWPIGLQGYGNEATRISTGFSTYIYIYCVAITDTKDETALIMSIDAGGGGFEKYIRPVIESEFGIPQDHIILSAIHQHSTPYGGEKYIEMLVNAGKKAAKQALEDRAPATMLLNTVETHALSFVRHYIANDPAGSIVTDNYNDAIGANIMAFINRLTAVFRTNDFSRKRVYAIVVSGYSGGDIVAQQIMGAINMNKNFILPAKFALMATANNPGSVLEIEDIDQQAAEFAEQILLKDQILRGERI